MKIDDISPIFIFVQINEVSPKSSNRHRHRPQNGNPKSAKRIVIPPTIKEAYPDKMKTNFALYCSHNDNVLRNYIIQSISPPKLHRKRMDYDEFMGLANSSRNPPDEHIRRLIFAQREGFERPPPTAMSIPQKNAIILRELQRFDPNPTTFEDKSFNLNFDGWDGHIRQIYLPKPRIPVSQRDIEYYIHLDNYKECKYKSEEKCWGAFIYINEPDHLCNGTYKSIEGTHFGVQHTRF
jgi:hypothetical protein